MNHPIGEIGYQIADRTRKIRQKQGYKWRQESKKVERTQQRRQEMEKGRQERGNIDKTGKKWP
jgi:hypothetical protein